MYADDGIMYTKAPEKISEALSASKIEKELSELLLGIGVRLKKSGCRLIYVHPSQEENYLQEELPETFKFKFLGLIYDGAKDLFYSSTRRGATLELRLTMGIKVLKLINKVSPYVFSLSTEVLDYLELRMLNYFEASKYHSLEIFYEQKDEVVAKTTKLYDMIYKGFVYLKTKHNMIEELPYNQQLGIESDK